MDGDGAVREVAQVYERIKLQQPLLLHYSSSSQSPPPPSTTTTRLAHNLLGQALRALNVALSVMKQQQLPAAALSRTEVIKAEHPAADSQATASRATTAATTRGKRRRSSSSSVMEGRANKKPSPSSSSSWVDFTTVPYEDGYEWRKYGEKKINGAGHTRSYFRCTYKDGTGCRATKHVQQSDDVSSDPPVFQVTYNGKHTCSTTSGAGGECTAPASTSSSAAFVASSSGVGAARVKQEPPPAAALPPPPPPPLVAAEPYYSALPFHRTAPPLCQDLPLFPVVAPRRFRGTTVGDCHAGCVTTSSTTTPTTSSCISAGESSSSDEYSASGGGEDMAARMAGVQAAAAPADDVVPFNDLELFLLCNSFKDY